MDAPEPITDDRGRAFAARRYERIVSLVPSITETLIEMGGGDRLIGRTRWCVRPEAAVAGVPVVGGTKDVDPERILALRPDIVIANREENEPEIVSALESSVPVFVTYPRSVAAVVDLCRSLAALLDLPDGRDLADAISRELRRTVSSRRPSPLSVATLIWWRPMMAAGRDTYLSDLLSVVGGGNALPPSPDRYPTLTLAGILDCRPDAILLPDEPFHFTTGHARRLARDLESRAKRAIPCVILPGDLVTWFGARSLVALPALADRIRGIGER